MSIRAKVVFIVLPLIIAPLLLTGFISSLSARNGITSIATNFLRFKMDDIINYANSQWSLLVENDLAGKPEYVDATKTAVISYAQSLVRGDSELIFALDRQGKVAMASRAISLNPSEAEDLGNLAVKGAPGWVQIRVEGADRVAQASPFDPFGWYIFVTEKRDTFYAATSQIFLQTGLILSASLVAAVLLLLFFSNYLTQPIRLIASAMREIISTNDLSKRVEILYKDETGELGHSFNLMTEELDKAYKQIKGYALKAVIAQHREQKIRNIFQKYVPKAVIDEFFANPESMLVGQERLLAVLFSDIRGFTGISERMLPNEVVESLNAYFAAMVEIIIKHRGIVDKYIGDAIMAFFGAPVRYNDEGYQATVSGLEMLDALKSFNAQQKKQGRPTFAIGIGINYGVVTVGNIGSERKMDYTVIGDMVNVASRLEGLTKVYKQEMIISDSVARCLEGKIPCRMIDKVVVKGKTSGIGIYAPRRELSSAEQDGWTLYNQALTLYYNRDFHTAAETFGKVLQLIPGDGCAGMFLERCRTYQRTPPPEDWTGAVVMSEK
jgi:class 3 adenylate cyclase/HAMP domain-containing protein